MSMAHRWIKNLLSGMDEKVDARTRAGILENCGRQCTPQSLVKKATSCAKKARDTGEFIVNLQKVWKNVHLEDGKVFVIYPRCYCPLVRDYEGTLPGFCDCSRGWILELFESALGRPVKVILEKSIRQGDDSCRFRVEV